LILSDVVLPNGVTGRDLAREARQVRPDVAVLLMSGYPGDHLSDTGSTDTAIDLISKPFRKAELGERLRALLDTPSRSKS